ncbi:MAG: putative selenate reductase subunit YgfK, partial [Chloroflexi bacterium]
MRPLSFDVLLNWILTELEENDSIFGIHRSLFYEPREDNPYATTMFGHYLATPIGPGAGPHTQLAQNIVCAWLSGARFIELKTVQIKDELEIPRPCIDMEDEGYNVEWSQELKLDQSVGEYVKAWALIHVLRRVLGFEGAVPCGTIFNMSVGYDLDGIQSPPMTRFMDRLEDASEQVAEIGAVLRKRFPQFADVEIPSRITNNVTLSTMHGCPPDEIEQIGRYLLEERGLHTVVKLNPTLLGKEEVMRILHDCLGFEEIHIPGRVFEHDLQYDRAVELIRTLQEVAAARGLTFGVKLSNTLAMANHKGLLPGDEVYMSGRALYPITMNLFNKLAHEFAGGPAAGSAPGLNVSYSAGADALNVPSILAAGPRPVTSVSDILKPRVYSRFLQYLENLEREMRDRGVADLEELSRDWWANLEREAAHALENPRYKKGYHPHGLPKVESGLELFDCVTAPCVERCAVCQDVPEYAWLISRREYDRALEVILLRNPLPGVTGYVCTHLCQTRCTRNNYDEPVAIRALKRFAAGRGSVTLKPAAETGHRVAVIGSGPSGLSAAYFLSLNGVQVTVFEARDRAGGMLSIAPAFRLPEAVVKEDVDRIKSLGVRIELSHPLTEPPETLLDQGFDAVYLAPGFQEGARPNVEGCAAEGVFQALDVLERVARGETVDLGRRVLVVGGGNTAMDVARTARRITGGEVTVVYRRTRREMPATEEEIEGLLAEGIGLEELASPQRVLLEEGRVVGLTCIRNRLGAPGADGRRRPEPIPGSAFDLPADAVIIAIGQSPDLLFLDGSGVVVQRDGRVATCPPGVYAGGDVVRGPAIIIAACADGRQAAEAICEQLGIPWRYPMVELPVLSEEDILAMKRVRARRIAQHEPEVLPPDRRNGFDLIEMTLSEEDARAEAARCLQCATLCDKCVEVCPNRANYTVSVTPKTWSLPVLACSDDGLSVTGSEPFVVTQNRQIVHIDDLCNECGNCATFCVHIGKPYHDKPRLFLDREAFQEETENAYYIGSLGAGDDADDISGSTIHRREDGRTLSLTAWANGAGYTYRDGRFVVR